MIVNPSTIIEAPFERTIISTHMQLQLSAEAPLNRVADKIESVLAHHAIPGRVWLIIIKATVLEFVVNVAGAIPQKLAEEIRVALQASDVWMDGNIVFVWGAPSEAAAKLTREKVRELDEDGVRRIQQELEEK